MSASDDLLQSMSHRKFSTVLADPPWQFTNRTGKMAPEHKRLSRYPTMSLQEIKDLPVEAIVKDTAHLYLWVPNALLPDGLAVMSHWGFTYKSNLICYKIRKDGGPDRRGVGFYFRNVTEVILFGVRGKNARTLQPGRSQENIISTQKREHSRKPDEQYELIEACSPPALTWSCLREAGARTGPFGATNPMNTHPPGIPTLITRKRTSFSFQSPSLAGAARNSHSSNGRLLIRSTTFRQNAWSISPAHPCASRHMNSPCATLRTRGCAARDIAVSTQPVKVA